MSLWRRHRTDAILGVVAVLLVVLVLADRGSVSTAEAEDRKYQLIDAWRADDITRVEIQVGEVTMLLRAVDDPGAPSSWLLEENGKSVDVDDQAVGQLLVSLEFAAYERTVEGLDATAMGFDAPRARYRIAMGKLDYELALGKEAPSPAGGAYVRVSGGGRGTVDYVVGPELVSELMLEPGALRSRRLAPYLSIDTRAYELDGPTGRFRLERGTWGGRTAGQFLVKTTGPAVRADRRQLDGWLIMLGRLQVERFLPVPAELAKPRATLTIEPLAEDGTRAVLLLGLGGEGCEAGQTLVVRRAPEPVAGCVPEGALDPILLDPAKLRDEHVVGTAKGDITEIRWTAGDLKVELARKEEGWYMRAPSEGPAEPEPVEQLLEAMLDVEGEIVGHGAEREAWGLSEPRATVQLRGLPERGVGVADERVERLEVGARTDDGVFVRRLDDDVVLRVAVEPARAFLPRPAALRATQIFDVPLEDVAGLELDCDGKRQRFTRLPAGSWTLEEPEAPIGVDMGLANGLAESFRQLEAVRWVSERPEEDHELATPWCRVTMVVRAGDDATRRLTVQLGAETTGGYFARRADAPAVFVAPRGLGQLASRWLLDTGALMVSPT
ncbi:MAG TPA: DUF4340 domain-containing protein, partial [Polyangiaceae bacterium]|nr:DUF4340 domain-containing protein [Polyangiaceae bacterium]